MAEQRPGTGAGATAGEGAARLRHETFRDLYFAERARRESIRGSIGIPAAAVSFMLYANMTLVAKVDVPTLLDHPPSLVLAALVGLAVILLVASVWRMVQVEWLFVYSEPPDVDELVRVEQHVRGRHARADLSEDDLAAHVEAEMRDVMTAGYYIAYQRYFAGNTNSARHRTWAMRLVLAAFLCLFGAGLLLPFHMQAAGS